MSSNQRKQGPAGFHHVSAFAHTRIHKHTERAEGNARQWGLDSVESLQGEEKNQRFLTWILLHPSLSSAPSPLLFSYHHHLIAETKKIQTTSNGGFFVIYSVSSLSTGPQHNQEGLSQKAKRNTEENQRYQRLQPMDLGTR